MANENDTPLEQIPTVIAYRVLSGVALGLVLLLVYLVCAMWFTFYSVKWNMASISLFASVPIVCGLLSAVFGKRFLQMLLAVTVKPLGTDLLTEDRSKTP